MSFNNGHLGIPAARHSTVQLELDMLTPIFLILLIFLMYVLTKRRKDLPPGPPCLPIIGNVGQFDSRNLVKECRRLRKKYGDVFCIMIAHKPMIVVNGVKTLKDCFVKNGDFTSERPGFFYSKVICKGLGIVGSSGSAWKAQRTFALTTLRSLRVGKRCLENSIQKEAANFLKVVEKENEKPFDIYSALLISVSNIICAIVFGKLFERDDKDFRELLDMFYKHMSNHKTGSLLNFFPSLRHVPGDIFGSKRIMNNLANVDNMHRKFISEHRKSFNEENIRDYIDAFLLVQKTQKDDESKKFSDEQLLRTISDLFGAGTETTTTTLSWAVLFIVRYPEVQNKMRMEIERAIGMDQLPSLAHKQMLPYCEAVIAESQRLGNIAPIALPHGVKEDFVFQGHVIPKDAFLLPNLDSVAQDPDLFPDPEKFNPDRYLDARGKFKGQENFAPFFIGRRACLGENIARAELFLFLVAIVQNFELLPEHSEKLPSVEGVFGITYSPQPFKIRARKRV